MIPASWGSKIEVVEAAWVNGASEHRVMDSRCSVVNVWRPGRWRVCIVRPVGHLYERDFMVGAVHEPTGAHTELTAVVHALGRARKRAGQMATVMAGWGRERPWSEIVGQVEVRVGPVRPGEAR